ncbi:MAG: RloB family protein [Dehalococcoidales bacterium]
MIIRKFPKLVRRSGIRIPRLIIIASEGTNTEKTYFEDMSSAEYYRNPRVHVEVLERENTDSSPGHVLDCLDNYTKKYHLSLKKDDELWLVIDRDKWTEKELSAVASTCQQKCYFFAVSNPCFELWLLLHIKSLDDYGQSERNDFTKNKHINRKKTLLEQELCNILGSYNKANLDTSRFLPFIDRAIERARLLDIVPTERWPNRLGTRVYLLAESIIKR